MKPFKDIIRKYDKYVNDAKESIAHKNEGISCENLNFFFENVQKEAEKFWNFINKFMVQNMSDKTH